jgi:hypothetical protein
MLWKSKSSEARRLFANSIVGCGLVGFTVFWLYLCCAEHWRRTVGVQNLVLLIFHALISFTALMFLMKRAKTAYHVTVLVSLIPGLIVCFINRSARYPDFDQLIQNFSSANSDDPAVLGFKMIYTESFLVYDYIVTRSSTASGISLVLQILWTVIALFF